MACNDLPVPSAQEGCEQCSKRWHAFDRASGRLVPLPEGQAALPPLLPHILLGSAPVIWVLLAQQLYSNCAQHHLVKDFLELRKLWATAGSLCLPACTCRAGTYCLWQHIKQRAVFTCVLEQA